MATILLAAAGAQLGAGFGGTILGLSGAVIGRAVGATVGRVIDQRLMGAGSAPVETGRIDRMRIQSAGEGVAIPRIWGQMRVPGHVIWAGPLVEHARSESAGGGKGAPKPQVTRISYSLSFALALCEGRISGVGRVWADGEEIDPRDLVMQVYHGTEDQTQDATIAAHEGADTPAYRGLAYVVISDLGLERWGNRMPQLTFEVTRPAQDGSGLAGDVQAVAMIPGTGEYALATTPVTQDLGLGEMRAMNTATPMGGTDFAVSLDVLGRELPGTESVSLVVSWFGDDLRIGQCTLRPKVEQRQVGAMSMPWRAGGIGRAQAHEVARIDDRPIYGGTPCDQSVIEAMRAITAQGKKAVFYPFILMEQVAGNGLPDPYGAEEQPVMPWRGRITTAMAPGQPGSTDNTAQAEAEVAAFFGTAQPGDFTRAGDVVSYHGPDEWGYRRFILHYAHLCAAAGEVDAFLIGSEMVAMTRIRGADGGYPAVEALRVLAGEVRAILGPSVRIGYAADWSEYYGHHMGDGAMMFHLDPLWADAAIDFVGIDNYMPLADWRDGDGHADAGWGSIYNDAYLRANVAGGEGFDWYYRDREARDAQIRTPITDGAYGEPWVWRYKDIAGWWGNRHHNRPGGVRDDQPTGWVPGSKPVWFTEIGCAAMDKGANQPNKFIDLLSSESSLPFYSNGRRDDAMQAAYMRALMGYWRDPANNPRNAEGMAMVDCARAHVWAWDARPYPAFPARRDLWSDSPAHERGHWLNGRAGAVPLASVVAEICADAGIDAVDVSGLHGVVRGYGLAGHESGRAALQPLMLAHGFDAVERDGVLRFVMRDGLAVAQLGPDQMALAERISGPEITRSAEAETVGRIRLTHVEAGADYAAATVETMLPGADFSPASDSEFAMVLTRAEGRAIAERWLAEAGVARDTVRFALPPSLGHLGAGDVVTLRHDAAAPVQRWRIDRVERAGALTVDAVRVEPGVYVPAEAVEDETALRRYVPPMPVWPVVMDLPLLRGDEAAHAPWLAATARPWPGGVAVWASAEAAGQGGFTLNTTLDAPCVVGVTETALPAARAGVIDRGPALAVRLKSGTLANAALGDVLNGANVLAIGDGTAENWEIIQFTRAVPGEQSGQWLISERLRGQAGSDGIMPPVWPAGSVVVLMNGAPRQADLAPNARGQMRHWRFGPASRGPDDASYQTLSLPVTGVGLRPYAPCHLRLTGARISWVRRSRIDGDGWDGADIPLGESREVYALRIVKDGAVIHEAMPGQPHYDLPPGIAALRPFRAEVAQLSDQFGAGPFVRRDF